MTVAPTAVTLSALGATEQLSVRVLDQYGRTMTGVAVVWTTRAPVVATVNGEGLVMAVGNGSATITATAGTASGTADVTVLQEVRAVSLTPAADTLLEADTLRVVAEATDSNGNAVADAELFWSSSDTLVARVDDTGLVAGVAAGDVEISVMSSGFTAVATVVVVVPAPTGVSVTPDTISLVSVGQQLQLSAEVRDQAGRTMEDAVVSWSSSESTVAAVSPEGQVTAVANGQTVIGATAGEAAGEALVTVMQVANVVVVSPAYDTIAPGDTLRLAAEALDKNGHTVREAEFAWSSSDVAVGWVGDSGLLTGISPGVTVVTAATGMAAGTARITVANRDRAALTSLYHSTKGPSWNKNGNWLTDAPLDEWHGVRTDGWGRVSEIRLGWNKLSGEIPAEIGDLTHLRHLHLQVNDLLGPIPPEILKLVDLETLDLGWNELTGPIHPGLGDLHNLKELQLGPNKLEGPVPRELAELTRLEKLDIGGNRLTGHIPPEFGELGDLTQLKMGYSDLSGPIPPELGNLERLTVLHLAVNDLSGPIPIELSNVRSLVELDLGYNNLTGPIPPELGALAHLRLLKLHVNGLSGPIPPQLGELTSLAELSLRYNALAGPLPASLLDLTNLTSLRLANNVDLCVPGTSAFLGWIRGIEETDESDALFCSHADRQVLERQFATAGGPGWTHSDGWLATPALDQWYGVSADSLGRVTAIDLGGNGLEGKLSTRLAWLSQMTDLDIGDNPGLAGRFPLALSQLPLETLRYSGTSLCVPTDRDFRSWLETIQSHDGTGTSCVPLSDRDVLEVLYSSTNGQSWNNARNWMTNAPLASWWGVSVDWGGRVTGLRLPRNNLKGDIPSELGELRTLRDLILWDNSLTGPIPPELGQLDSLVAFDIGYNALTGAVPAELGNLAGLKLLKLHSNRLSREIPPEVGDLGNLSELLLWRNNLTGPIPSELGKLSQLDVIDFGYNRLTGQIPAELGNLADLELLKLHSNRLSGEIPREIGDLGNLSELLLWGNNLTGPIPSELGNLSNLRDMDLSQNALTGPIPPSFGNLFRLRWLVLSHNAGLDGPLPVEMTALRDLDELLASGTGLCAPPNPDFASWLATIQQRRIMQCDGMAPIAYLTQAVQSPDHPVPLVGGRRALLRVFPTALHETTVDLPVVRARFSLDGLETYVVDIPAKPDPIPVLVNEASLSGSSNVEIPGHVIRPGLEAVIEIDPDRVLDPALGVVGRVPETGRLTFDVLSTPTFDLTLIPFVWMETHDSSIVDLVGAMADDPENHEMLGETRAQLPIGPMRVSTHEPVLSSSNDGYVLLAQTNAIRIMEGGVGHYKGMMSPPVLRVGGVAYMPGRSSFSQPYPSILAHELGHNMSLAHAPCGGPGGVDRSFPYLDGTIGSWGYDFRDGGRVVAPSTRDVMSYCDPPWISDYHFTKSLRFRVADEGHARVSTQAPPTKSLLLWGGTNADGTPFLDPAFVLMAHAALPDSGGDHWLVGRAANGAELFSFSFAMERIADGDGQSSFFFLLPVQPEWQDSLGSIALSGPGGDFVLDDTSDHPMVILRDPRSGQVRGFLRDSPAQMQADAGATGAADGQLQVLFSRGLPDSAHWRP